MKMGLWEVAPQCKTGWMTRRPPSLFFCFCVERRLRPTPFWNKVYDSFLGVHHANDFLADKEKKLETAPQSE
jgi:hypothetical protein